MQNVFDTNHEKTYSGKIDNDKNTTNSTRVVSKRVSPPFSNCLIWLAICHTLIEVSFGLTALFHSVF